MSAKIPAKLQKDIRARVYAAADSANYLQSSRTDNSMFIEKLCADPEIGILLAQHLPKERVRTYIKDAVLNRYAKERKRNSRPTLDDLIAFCARQYQIADINKVEESKQDEVILLKSRNESFYIVLAEGTVVKWESALRKGLEYIASKPLGQRENVIIRIVLSLYVGGSAMTPSDTTLLQRALARAGALAHLWGRHGVHSHATRIE